MLDVSGPSFGCPKRTILYAGPWTRAWLILIQCNHGSNGHFLKYYTVPLGKSGKRK